VRRDLAAAVAVLGIGDRRAEEFLAAERARALNAGRKSIEEVEAIVAERAAARAAKQWQRADDLRRGLLDAGIALEDSAAGTTWRPTSWGIVAPTRKAGAR